MAPGVWYTVGMRSYFLRFSYPEGAGASPGQMVGSPASGESLHFLVLDTAVSPVPGFIQGAQFPALVLEP